MTVAVPETPPAADAPQAAAEATAPDGRQYLTQPLVTEIYTADPSAHVFEGRIYIYGSHDIEGTTPEDDMGSHFEMRDYQVLSMDSVGGPVTVHPVALDVARMLALTPEELAPTDTTVGSALGLDTAYFDEPDPTALYERGVKILETIHVNRPAQELYDFWHDYQNHPRFMPNVEAVRVEGGGVPSTKGTLS